MKYIILSIIVAIICLTPVESKASAIPVDSDPRSICSKFESVLELKYKDHVLARKGAHERYTFVGKTGDMRQDFFCEYKVLDHKSKIRTRKVVLHSNDGSWKFER